MNIYFAITFIFVFIESISDEKTQLQKRKSSSVDNIVLKTTQAEKIAEISRKIEKQVTPTNNPITYNLMYFTNFF